MSAYDGRVLEGGTGVDSLVGAGVGSVACLDSLGPLGWLWSP